MGEESVMTIEEDKVVIEQAPEEKPNESKALIVVDRWSDYAEHACPTCDYNYYSEKLQSRELAAVPSPENGPSGSNYRDAALAKVETGKRNSLIKAWEESQLSKAENKSQMKMSSIGSWENTKQAWIEAEMKKYEEALEMKKAQNVEKMKNKIVMIHKEAEERRAMVEAKREEELLNVDEEAAKYKATGLVPKKGFFSF